MKEEKVIEHNDETIVMSQETTSANTAYPGKPLTDEDMALSIPGYEIVSKIGSGGMGHVFLARQISLKRLVAIKVLAFSEENSAQLDAVMAEAATMADLNHPNIVICHDIIHDGRFIYLVMEYVPGQMSLRRLVKRYGCLPESVVVRILSDIVNGLSYIKSRGYIHHDLKPDNLLVYNESNAYFETVNDLFASPDIRVKICDFGVATHVRNRKRPEGTPVEDDASENSSTGIVGTPNYMAPEQITNPGGSDYRSDIYALGCTALFMLTGRQPFEIEDRTELFRHKLTHDIPTPDEMGVTVNSSLSSLIGRMGKVDPDERCNDYDGILSELEEIADELPEKLLRRHRGNRGGRTFWRNACIAMLAVLFFLLIFSGRACVRKEIMKRRHHSLTERLDYWSGVNGGDWKIKRGAGRRRPAILYTEKASKPISVRSIIRQKRTLEFEVKHPDDGAVRFELNAGPDRLIRLNWNRTDGDSDFTLFMGDVSNLEDVDGTEDWLKCRFVVDMDTVRLYINGDLVKTLKSAKLANLVFTIDMMSAEKLMLKNVYLYDNE